MSSSPRPTVEVIIDGAMRALARHGQTRLSMTDICRESGVSRGTLYRYFASREAVLEAVSLQVVAVSKETFDKAVADDPDLTRRVRVVLHTMLGFPNHFPHMAAMFEHEPRIALDFLAEAMPGMLDRLTQYLEPALEAHPATRNGALPARDLAEFLYRLVTSSFLIPTTDPAELEAKVTALWDLSWSTAEAVPAGPTIDAQQATS
jgi:AcrR family transcriptional regulator